LTLVCATDRRPQFTPDQGEIMRYRVVVTGGEDFEVAAQSLEEAADEARQHVASYEYWHKSEWSSPEFPKEVPVLVASTESDESVEIVVTVGAP
jgi:hypothetical protein